MEVQVQSGVALGTPGSMSSRPTVMAYYSIAVGRSPRDAADISGQHHRGLSSW
jgi:hypothetical protein